MKKILVLVSLFFIASIIHATGFYDGNVKNNFTATNLTATTITTTNITSSSSTVTGSNFSVGGSTFVVTGGKVGIGVSPTDKLNVYGTGANYNTIFSTAADGTGNTLVFDNSGRLKFGKPAGTNEVEFNTDAFYVTRKAGGTNYFTIASGNTLNVSGSDAYYGVDINQILNLRVNNVAQFRVSGSSCAVIGHLVCSGLSAAGTGTALVISASNEVIPLTSSKKTKHNITGLKTDADKLMLLKASEYDYNGNNTHAIGFIAEDVYKVLPKVVNLKNGEPYSLSYDQMLALAIVKIQKQQKQIDDLIKRVQKLEKK